MVENNVHRRGGDISSEFSDLFYVIVEDDGPGSQKQAIHVPTGIKTICVAPLSTMR